MNLDDYLAAIKKDYADSKIAHRGEVWVEQQISEFNKKLTVEPGRKYIKIVTGGSVHSFIMKEDDQKFKKGDILKAATWAAPARNFARGNVITGDLKNVRWPGVI